MIRARLIADRDEWLSWRESNVNASEIAALFGDGIHPYLSPYKLWARKSGLIPRSETDNRDMKRGRLLEPVLLALLREEHPDWDIRQTNVYFDDPGYRLGATPDFDADRPDREGTGIIQGKIVRGQIFREHWFDEVGELRAPAWIALQTSAEAYLSGATWAGVAAMVDVDLHYVDIPHVQALIPKFQELAKDFWRRVEEKDPYDINWGRDAEVILAQYREDDGDIIDLTGDDDFPGLIAQREMYKDIEREGAEATKLRKGYDAQIIARLGNAAKARFAGGLVSAHTIRKKPYSVGPITYREVKVKSS